MDIIVKFDTVTSTGELDEQVYIAYKHVVSAKPVVLPDEVFKNGEMIKVNVDFPIARVSLSDGSKLLVAFSADSLVEALKPLTEIMLVDCTKKATNE